MIKSSTIISLITFCTVVVSGRICLQHSYSPSSFQIQQRKSFTFSDINFQEQYVRLQGVWKFAVRWYDPRKLGFNFALLNIPLMHINSLNWCFLKLVCLKLENNSNYMKHLLVECRVYCKRTFFSVRNICADGAACMRACVCLCVCVCDLFLWKIMDMFNVIIHYVFFQLRLLFWWFLLSLSLSSLLSLLYVAVERMTVEETQT